jgi:hypothetical protein
MLPDILKVIMSLISWVVILIKFGTSRHMFNTEFRINVSVGAALPNADRWTDRRKELSRERKRETEG